jgi:hypothetical protein
MGLAMVFFIGALYWRQDGNNVRSAYARPFVFLLLLASAIVTEQGKWCIEREQERVTR